MSFLEEEAPEDIDCYQQRLDTTQNENQIQPNVPEIIPSTQYDPNINTHLTHQSLQAPSNQITTTKEYVNAKIVSTPNRSIPNLQASASMTPYMQQWKEPDMQQTHPPYKNSHYHEPSNSQYIKCKNEYLQGHENDSHKFGTASHSYILSSQRLQKSETIPVITQNCYNPKITIANDSNCQYMQIQTVQQNFYVPNHFTNAQIPSTSMISSASDSSWNDKNYIANQTLHQYHKDVHRNETTPPLFSYAYGNHSKINSANTFIIQESIQVPEPDNEVIINSTTEFPVINQSNSEFTINKSVENIKPATLSTKSEEIAKESSNLLLKKQGSSKRKENLKSNHHNQTIKRLSTLEGWKQMNAWLKVAIKTSDVTKLKSLLTQCYQVDISAELLKTTGIDTPKLVKKLSKTSKESDVKEIAQRLFSKWFQIVQTSENKEKIEQKCVKSENMMKISELKNELKAKISKEEHESNIATKKKTIVLPIKDMPPIDSHQDSNLKTNQKEHPLSVSLLNKVESEMNESRKKIVSKKVRPKTAKVYTRNFRMTGLEDELENKKAKSISTVSKRRSSLSISDKTTNNQSTKLVIATPSSPNTSSPKISKEFNLASSNITENEKSLVEKDGDEMNAHTSNKRSIMPCDTFMDALLAPPTKKSKIVKKKMNNGETNLKEKLAVIHGNLYQETINNSESSLPNPTNLETADLISIKSSSTKRIHFADEKGLNLINIRYFEIEEGERINVTKRSPEDMKHFEMHQEGRYMKEIKSGLAAPWATELPLPKGVYIKPWKLIPLHNAIQLIEHGVQSEAGKIEFSRQQKVMEVFYDPLIPMFINDELDEYELFQDQNHVIKIIPLDMHYEEHEKIENKKAEYKLTSSDTFAQSNYLNSHGLESLSTLTEEINNTLEPILNSKEQTNEETNTNPKVKILSSLGININSYIANTSLHDPLPGSQESNKPSTSTSCLSDNYNVQEELRTEETIRINIPADIKNLLEDVKKSGLVSDTLHENESNSISFSELSGILSKVQVATANLSTLSKEESQSNKIFTIEQEFPDQQYHTNIISSADLLTNIETYTQPQINISQTFISPISTGYDEYNQSLSQPITTRLVGTENVQEQISSTSLAYNALPQCTFYLRGSCRFGQNCRNAHGNELTEGVRSMVSGEFLRRGIGIGRGGNMRGSFVENKTNQQRHISVNNTENDRFSNNERFDHRRGTYNSNKFISNRDRYSDHRRQSTRPRTRSRSRSLSPRRYESSRSPYNREYINSSRDKKYKSKSPERRFNEERSINDKSISTISDVEESLCNKQNKYDYSQSDKKLSPEINTLEKDKIKEDEKEKESNEAEKKNVNDLDFRDIILNNHDELPFTNKETASSSSQNLF